jgi:hypothetical protein
VPLAALALLAAGGCRKPKYDTSSPQKAVEALEQMVRDGRPELLPTMLFVEARDVTFADGVTEASAIEDVKRKAGDMVAQLWRVSRKLKQRYPKEVDALVAQGGSWATGQGGGDIVAKVVADPFGWLDANQSRLAVEDLGDGTAAFSLDGKPVLGGVLTMVETKDGWRVTFPAQLVRQSEYFPDTREEWAVVASMMIAVEQALNDCEREIDSGRFPTLQAASERAGRLVGESAAAQAVIYAMMQRNQPGKEKPKDPVAGVPMEKVMGQAGNEMRRRAEQRD